MTESKVKKEQDFFDMQSLIDQLQHPSTDDIVVDDYMGI